MQVFERSIESVLIDLKSLDFDVRRQAIRDLAVSDFEDKINVLSDLLNIEQDIQIKYELRKTINELQSLERKTTSKEDDARLANLRRAFQSSNSDVVNKAFHYALEHNLVEFLPEMMMIENYTFDPFQRTCIIKMMQRASSKSFRYIIEYLDDEDHRVVATAVEALEEIGNTAALASIARLMEHPHNRVQAAAAKALHNLGDDRAFALFTKMIQSPFSAYRDSAAYSLAQMSFTEGVKLLAILLLDEVESVRIKALRGLELMANNQIEEASKIIERLREKDPYGLWADKIFERMNKTEDAQESEDLLQIKEKIEQRPAARELAALYSDANQLRMAAIQKLAEDDSGEETVNMITERLKLEKDNRIIASAVLALGRAKGPAEEKKKILLNYLSHYNERVRSNAIEALTYFTQPNSRIFMVKCLDDTSNRVIGNAIVALWDTFKNRTEKALDDLVNSPHKVCQLTAVYCIGELADWKLACSCRLLLKSKYPVVKAKMEEALHHLRDIPAFANVLKDYLETKSKEDLPDEA